MIEQSVVQSVVEAANSQIVDIISDFVQLKRRGANYFGCCPFHNEKTGSFSVAPAKGFYKCFGCGKTGTAVGFVMDLEHLTFPEAIKYLGNRLGIQVVEKNLTNEEKQLQSERESMMALNDFAVKHFEDNLWNDPDGQAVALTYFRERGFRDDTIKKFQLGYSMPKRTALVDAALAVGFKPEYLQKTGLVIFGENNFRADKFAGRVMFPIHNLSGKAVAFGGRLLDKRTKGVTAKYINSPESELYHKSDIVYGLFHAKTAISRLKSCYLVEGYTDVISMHQAGLENVVASCGTALTQSQIRLIKRFTDNITVLYDGDEAGIKASEKGIDLILQEGMNVRVLLLPDGEDPDSFARSHTAEECVEYIESHQTDFIHYMAEAKMKNVGSDATRRAETINEIMRLVSKVQDRVLREVYLQDCSKLLEIDEQTLKEVLQETLVRENNLQRENRRKEQLREQYMAQRQMAEQSAAGLNLPPSSPEELAQMQMAMGVSPNQSTLAPVNAKPKNIFRYEEEQLLRLLVKYANFPIKLDTGDSILAGDLLLIELDKDEKFYQSIDPVFMKVIDSFRSAPDHSKIDSAFFINSTDIEIGSLAARLLQQDTTESTYHAKFRTIQSEEELLPEIIERLFNELRFKITTASLDSLSAQLAQLERDGASDDDLEKVQIEMQEWNTLKRHYSQLLGNRSVIRIR